MKKKEMVVYINPSILEDDSFGVFYKSLPRPEAEHLKAKLIIEVPEKSTTITESELESVLGETECVNGMDMYYRIKNKLFGNG